MIRQERLTVATRGRGTYDISAAVRRFAQAAGVATGVCHIFVHHTSASLILCENADPDVRRDLEAFMAREGRDGDPLFEHSAEGPDDMSAHIRTILTSSSLSVPVSSGSLALGAWQGIYLWEHRTQPHRRDLTLTLQGE